jgi:hypothetical protein
MSLPTIRLACFGDAQAISAIVLRCLHEVNVKDYGSTLTAQQAQTWTMDGVLGRLRERIMFAAVSGEEVVASRVSMASRQGRYSCGRIGMGKALDHCSCAPSRSSLLKWVAPSSRCFRR